MDPISVQELGVPTPVSQEELQALDEHSEVTQNGTGTIETGDGNSNPKDAAEILNDVFDYPRLLNELPADSDSENEADMVLAEKQAKLNKYPTLSSTQKIRTQLKNRSKRLAIQSNLHTQVVEDRLTELEKMVRTLLKDPPPEDMIEDKDIVKPLPHELSIKHMNWESFSARVVVPEIKERRFKWRHGLEVDGVVKNVIEILVEEPYTRSPWASWASRNESLPNLDLASYNPHQIRIRSPLILKLLEHITKQKVMIGPHKHQILLYRPFKLLIAFADQIFDFLEVLEKKWAGQPLSLGELIYRSIVIWYVTDTPKLKMQKMLKWARKSKIKTIISN
jgi:hypothetical protein